MPVKFVPVIVTIAPVAPLVGVNDAIVGAGMKVKVALLVAMPPAVVTVMVPVAPVPRVAVIVVSLTTVKATAAVLPKATAVVPVK